ncbi:MAG: polysaccharide deacetylase family protein [Candidatus Aceula meridiana]|nr:polysaccharide deacetylase family protein [Candidatus Aceula meridiana]
MKKFGRILIVIFLIAVVVWTYRVEFSRKYVVPIMMYHNVEDEENVDHLNGTSVVNFDTQMTFLKKWKYNVISLKELVDASTSQNALPHNSVVITFDDGYADNYYKAFPILKRHGFPATIFIVPEDIGKEGFLTWDQTQEMEAFGIMVQSHTLNGSYLPELSEVDQEREIKKSKRVIESKLNHKILFLCYPTGGFTPRVQELAREVGYKAACTTNRGYDRFNRNLYELNRIRFGDKDRFAIILWGKLSGYYNLFRKSVHPY